MAAILERDKRGWERSAQEFSEQRSPEQLFPVVGSGTDRFLAEMCQWKAQRLKEQAAPLAEVSSVSLPRAVANVSRCLFPGIVAFDISTAHEHCAQPIACWLIRRLPKMTTTRAVSCRCSRMSTPSFALCTSKSNARRRRHKVPAVASSRINRSCLRATAASQLGAFITLAAGPHSHGRPRRT